MDREKSGLWVEVVERYPWYFCWRKKHMLKCVRFLLPNNGRWYRDEDKQQYYFDSKVIKGEAIIWYFS